MDEIDTPLVKKGKATELSEKIAEVLYKLRTDRKLSQSDFADRLGVSFQQYQKYEKGRDRLSMEKAILLCAHLGLPLTVFMDDVSLIAGFGESEQEGFSSSSSSHSSEENELLKIFAAVPKKSKAQFLETVRQLAKMA